MYVKYWKAILALGGGLTVTTVIAIAQAMGADLTAEQAGAIVAVVTTLAVRFGPRNTTPLSEWAGLDEESHPTAPAEADV